MLSRLKESLGARGILFFCSCLIVILSAMTLMNVSYQKHTLEKTANDHVQEMARLVLTAMRNPMVNGDQDVIQKQFDGYKSLPDLVVAHLTDKNGIIRRSTDRSLIGQKPLAPYLKQALEGKEFHGIEVRKRTGQRIVTDLIPIFNEASCYPCHGSQDKVLGIVRLGLNWEKTIRTMEESRNWNILLSLIGLIMMSLLIAIFFLKIVVSPIRKLEIGMKKVSSGDFDLKLSVRTKDEIGNLTGLFNKMTVDLKETRQNLENIVNFLPDATFAIDKESKVISWNKAMEELCGRKAADMLGKGGYEYSFCIYNERKPMLIDLILDKNDEELLKRYSKVQREENTVTAEVFSPHLNNGKGMYLWSIASPLLDSQGKVIGAIESIRDISERQKSEEELKWKTAFLEAQVESTFDGVLVVDNQGQRLLTNQKLLDIWKVP
jgi:PAS domain-containing protein